MEGLIFQIHDNLENILEAAYIAPWTGQGDPWIAVQVHRLLDNSLYEGGYRAFEAPPCREKTNIRFNLRS